MVFGETRGVEKHLKFFELMQSHQNFSRKVVSLQHYKILLGFSLASLDCSNSTLSSIASFPSTKYVPNCCNMLCSQAPLHCDETDNKFLNNIQLAMHNHDKRRTRNTLAPAIVTCIALRCALNHHYWVRADREVSYCNEHWLHCGLQVLYHILDQPWTMVQLV